MQIAPKTVENRTGSSLIVLINAGREFFQLTTPATAKVFL